MAAYSTVNRHRLLSILVLTFFLVLFSLRDRISTSTIVSSVWKPSISSHHRPDQACSDGVEDILVIMKTGATEAYEKLPIHFVTTLKCFTNESLLLISDMEMDMGDNHHLIDILKDFPEILRKSNDDFALYDKLGHFNKLHQDSRKLENNGNGWKLDKYKFIPMLLQAWEHGSERGFKWYLFIEADSGIIWDNLRTYLNRLDSKEKHYIGSPTLSDIAFAHGGTGYVISRGAMEEAIGNHPEIGDRYNQDVQAHCCGVRFVARVLLDQGIAVTHAWPLFQGERPTTIPFTEQQWCQPVISMHHLTPEEVSQVWVFEQERKAKGIKSPLLYKDIFDRFVLDALQSQRGDWDNMSQDAMYSTDPSISPAPAGRPWDELVEWEKTAGRGVEDCKSLCEGQEECFQWLHKRNECYVGYSIKLGTLRSPAREKGWEEDVGYTSGWRLSKIGEFRERMAECREGPDWGMR